MTRDCEHCECRESCWVPMGDSEMAGYWVTEPPCWLRLAPMGSDEDE